MSAVELFRYEGAHLRTVLVESEPWFVAADACRMLSLRDTTSAMKMVHDDDKRLLHRSDTPQLFEGIAAQVQVITVVNESGMYALIFQSNKDRARDVRRWVTSEVLPSIRKTGSYGAPVLTEDEIVHRALTITQARVEALTAKVVELAASASAWNELAESTGDYSVADAAKVLSRDPSISIGRDRLFLFMSAERWLFKRDGRWRAYQAQVDCGRLAEKVGRPFWHEGRGELVAGEPTVRITPKGLAELHKRLRGTGQLALVSAL